MTPHHWPRFQSEAAEDPYRYPAGTYPVLADIFEMRDYGFTAEEIMEKHSMAKSTYYYQLKRIRDRWEEYNAD